MQADNSRPGKNEFLVVREDGSDVAPDPFGAVFPGD